MAAEHLLPTWLLLGCVTLGRLPNFSVSLSVSHVYMRPALHTTMAICHEWVKVHAGTRDGVLRNWGLYYSWTVTSQLSLHAAHSLGFSLESEKRPCPV